jgi:hypothetical protein
MKLAIAVKQVRENAAAFGAGAALHDLQLRALNRIVPVQVLRGMTCVLDETDPRLMRAPEYEARFARREELLRAAADPDLAGEMSAEFVESALARGDECFALFDRGRVAAFGWYSNQPTAIGGDLVLRFDPSWVYMYKGYTLPTYRGKRLHGVGMTLALRAYTGRGARGLISYVKSSNFQSLRSTEKMGFRIFGDIYVLRALGRVLTWATPGCQPYRFQLDWSPVRAAPVPEPAAA